MKTIRTISLALLTVLGSCIAVSAEAHTPEQSSVTFHPPQHVHLVEHAAQAHYEPDEVQERREEDMVHEIRPARSDRPA